MIGVEILVARLDKTRTIMPQNNRIILCRISSLFFVSRMRKNPSTGFIQSEIIDIIQSIIYNFQSNIYPSLFSPLAAVVPLDQQPSIKC
jgi:hypothetical protein